MVVPILLTVLMAAVSAAQICNDGEMTHTWFFEGINPVPWSVIPIPPPSSAQELNVTFLLFTRRNPDTADVISVSDFSAITKTHFQPEKKCVFIIHGLNSGGQEQWIQNLTGVLLKVEDVNIVSVDWHKGARQIYPQAVSNTREVSRAMAHFLNALQKHYNYTMDKVHSVGHCLGAHIAGQTGGRCPGTYRITGLDPAGPLMDGANNAVKLDPSDAELVVCISTDSSSILLNAGTEGFGTSELCGHVNILPNGGKQQPGCQKNPVLLLANFSGAIDMSSCNHLRGYMLFTEGVGQRNASMAYPAASYDAFEKGVGFPCSGKRVALGSTTDSYTGDRSKKMTFYMNTGSKKPFLPYRFMVSGDMTAGETSIGPFGITMQGPNRDDTEYRLSDTTSSGNFSTFLDVKGPGPPTNVTLIFHGRSSPPPRAQSVTVEMGHNSKAYRFCMTDDPGVEMSQTLLPCV